MNGRFDLAIDPFVHVSKLFPEAGMWKLWKALGLMYNNLTTEAYDFLCETVKEPGQESIESSLIFLKYALIYPGIIPGYKYDISISYLHKDNKYDG